MSKRGRGREANGGLTGFDGIATATIRQAVEDARRGDAEAEAWLHDTGVAWVAALLGEPLARAAKAVQEMMREASDGR